jgi:excisionase family DNA binding protein
MSAVTLRASRIAQSDEWLTVDEVCAELRITRRSFERWCRLGKGPRVKRLAGNGPIRIKRVWLNDWLEGDAA